MPFRSILLSLPCIAFCVVLFGIPGFVYFSLACSLPIYFKHVLGFEILSVSPMFSVIDIRAVIRVFTWDGKGRGWGVGQNLNIWQFSNNNKIIKSEKPINNSRECKWLGSFFWGGGGRAPSPPLLTPHLFASCKATLTFKFTCNYIQGIMPFRAEIVFKQQQKSVFFNLFKINKCLYISLSQFTVLFNRRTKNFKGSNNVSFTPVGQRMKTYIFVLVLSFTHTRHYLTLYHFLHHCI